MEKQEQTLFNDLRHMKEEVQKNYIFTRATKNYSCTRDHIEEILT